MKTIFKAIYILLSIIFLLYLAKPNIDYPNPPPDAAQSQESGDTEDPLRRAYFTNYSRQEVMRHYLVQMNSSQLLTFSLPAYKLNYPPEEAQTLIRDQTMTSYLEEIVHPFRESFYINGFKPTEQKDEIIINGVHWEQKITTRLIQGNRFIRLIVGLLTIISVPAIFFSWANIFQKKHA